MKISEMKIRQIIREELKDEPLQVDANTQIFCDMDGVLVDFAVGAIELANSIISGAYGAEFIQRSKSMRRALRDIEPGFKVQSSSDLDIPEVRNLMFAAIGFNPGKFFAGLPPLQDGLSTLWPFLMSSGRQVSLLTAPVNNRRGLLAPTAGDGKKAWAKEWLSPAPSEVIISPARNKPDYAITNGVPNILIDDKASTIHAWNTVTEEAGFGRGYGILHVTSSSAQTIQALRALGI